MPETLAKCKLCEIKANMYYRNKAKQLIGKIKRKYFSNCFNNPMETPNKCKQRKLATSKNLPDELIIENEGITHFGNDTRKISNHFASVADI